MKIFSRKTLYGCMVGFSFLLIITPNVGLFRERVNTEHVAEMENRRINPWPTAPILSSSWFNQFQDWYNDRILDRKRFILTWAMLNGRLFNVFISHNVVKGKDGYLFSPINMTHELVDSEQKLAKIQWINEECKKRKVRFVFSLAPNSEMILSDLFPAKYPDFNVGESEEKVRVLLAEKGVETCFFGGEMRKLSLDDRKNMYKTGDYHWTMAGAYFAAKRISRYLGYDDIVNYPVESKEVQVQGGGYYRDAGLTGPIEYYKMPWSKKFVSEFYVTDSRDSSLLNGKMQRGIGDYGQDGENIVINKNVANRRKILILGDSFTGGFSMYFLQDVHTMIFSHSRDLSKIKGKVDLQYMLDRYKPDVVLFLKMEAFFFAESYHEMFGNWK